MSKRRTWATIPCAAAALIQTMLPGTGSATTCENSIAGDPLAFEHLRAYRGSFATPTRLAVDSNDDVYILDPPEGKLVIREPSGKVVRVIRGLGYPISIEVDAGQRIFVGDGRSGRVDILDRDGNPLGHLGQGNGAFRKPAYLAVYESEQGTSLFVVDAAADKVGRYEVQTGSFEHEFGGSGTGPGEFLSPAGIAIRDAEVFVVDRGNSRIQVFDTNGVFKRIIAPRQDNCGFLCGFDTSRGRPRDSAIEVDSQGRIYLVESSKGRIVVLSPAGDVLASIGSFGTAPGELRVPTDIVFDSCRRLFVASAMNARVEMFGASGYQDPEAFAPAHLNVVSGRLDPVVDREIAVRLEVPGYRPNRIVELMANGIATPVSVEYGDYDRNAVSDLVAVFGRDLVTSMIGERRALIEVTGFVDDMRIEASAPVDFTLTELDSDGDGVANVSDVCPATATGAVVGTDGCSVSERCPCDGPGIGGSWSRHGEYLECVRETVLEFVRGGTIERNRSGLPMREAATSDCGKPVNPASDRQATRSRRGAEGRGAR